jgi:glutathione S-transferase
MPTQRIITDLALYIEPRCRWCKQVLSALEALDLSMEERNISKIEIFRDELSQATGKTTVPVLKITDAEGQDRWLSESNEIIVYLRQRFDTNRR